MYNKIIQDSTREEFEDVLFNPDLVVVQKEHSDARSHLTSVYVYENEGDKNPIYGVFREISSIGPDFWKETYNV